jgi:hypothetical protein
MADKMLDLTEDGRRGRNAYVARTITAIVRMSAEDRHFVLRRIAERTATPPEGGELPVAMPPDRLIATDDGGVVRVDTVPYRLEETACAICEQPLAGQWTRRPSTTPSRCSSSCSRRSPARA